MKFISLFAGIGGLDLGLERAGMECVAQVEIDDFCQKVLTKHWASVPKYKDVRDVGKENLPPADLICGGFPCQDVSLAGKRAGLEGKRSTLWSEYYRIICEIRPRWAVIENVSGLFSSDDGRFFTKILRELSEAGYHAEWGTIRANWFGATHRRERVFILANIDSKRLQLSKAKRELERQRSTFYNVEHLKQFGYFFTESGRKVDPSFFGNTHGLSARLDERRVKACGNSVVPQVAEFLGNIIMKAETCLTPREPDSLKAGDSCPPDVVKVESNLPA